MSIQGSPQRILDSVLPHEVTHMIFASHFRQPLPRWADEGGATSVEYASEKNKHRQMLDQFLRSGRGIAFSQMFAMTEYPPDIMPLYAQGYSLVEYLIRASGRRQFVEFLDDGLQSEDWSTAVARHYGVRDIGALQNAWLAWVAQGSPLTKPHDVQPAAANASLAADARRPRPEPNLLHRIRDKQSPPAPLAALAPVQITSSSAGQMAANVPQSAAKPLLTSGWRAPGAPMSSQAMSPPANDPPPIQVTCPPCTEQPRQTVLR
jgi:hypothetical protein